MDKSNVVFGMQKVISAGIIVFRRTPEGIKYLVLYQGRNYWNFPKGKKVGRQLLEKCLRKQGLKKRN
jgi:hypothetical protein